jgi:hypothetical protein
MITTETAKQRKWYREPYVWLIIALPLSAVIGGIITAWYAVESNDGLVVDDYYKRGLQINKVLDRDKAALRHELQASLQLIPGASVATIVLHGNDKFSYPGTISVSFLYSTHGGYDRTEELRRVAANTYQGSMPKLVKGRWYIQIEAQDWRLLESMTVH